MRLRTSCARLPHGSSEAEGADAVLGRAAALLRLHPAILLMAATHFAVDGYSNIFPPLLPLLIPRLGLSLAMAGTLTMCFQLAASVSQLAFGHVADRWRPSVLLTVGPVLCVAVLSTIGLAPSAWVLGAILVVGCLGAAAFHPPAAALVHRLAGERQGLAMALHITGGSLGFSVGPLVFAATIQRLGLEWSPVVALPGLVWIAFCLKRTPLPEPGHHSAARTGVAALRPYAFPLTLLYIIVVLRTLASLSFATFVPVMLTRRGMSVSGAAATISLFLFMSSVGGFVGGPLADRFGPKRVIALSLVLAVPFLVAAPLLEGRPFAIMLVIGGFFVQSTLPVNVTFGQQIAPVSAATVSSLMMGFAWGTGGLAVPLVGMLADRIDIAPTLVIMGLMPLAAAACALPLPGGRLPAFARGPESHPAHAAPLAPE
jgi:FSR family fosmidomycin resistance protein-like MFS transporter